MFTFYYIKRKRDLIYFCSDAHVLINVLLLITLLAKCFSIMLRGLKISDFLTFGF